MRAILKSLLYPSRSYATKAWTAMLVVLTMCLCATVANAQTAPLQPINVSQVNWLNPVLKGGVDWGGAPDGQNIAVNSNGDIFVGTNTDLEMVNGKTGVVTSIIGTNTQGWSALQGVTIDAQNNLYVADAYDDVVVKVPYLGNGAYAAFDDGTKTVCANFGANSSLDTTSCTMPSLTFSGNSYYFQIENIVVDAQGDLFWETLPSYGEGALWECSVACLGGTGSPIVIFQEPVNAAAQLQIGSMAFDPSGNLFFTDESGSGKTSNLNELLTSTSAGYGGVTTGFAAAPTVLYSYTPASAGDEIDGVAIDPATGTVYVAFLYSGVFAFPNNAGTVNTTQMYGISTQGSKLLGLDGKANPIIVSYQGSGDTYGRILVNNLAFPGSVQAGNSVTTAYNTTVNVGTPAVATVETGSTVTVVDNMTTCTADPTVTVGASGANAAEFSVAGTTIVPPATALLNPPCSGVLNGGASYPVTIDFTPSVGAVSTQSATITATDSASNSGTAAVTGSAPAPVFLTQVNWLNTLAGGGALASGNAAGSSFGINSATGDMIVSTSYGNKVLDINAQTGAETVLVDWGSDISQNYNVGPVALDSNNNLYVGGLYTNNVIKIPFVSGAYVAAPYPNLSGTPPTPANCTGSDTAECSFGSNLTNASNGYYFGIQSMTFDAAGDFFFSLTNANTAPEAIYECTAACLATGTPAATMIYMEPVSVVAAQYIVGGLAVDRWGNLFFTDSNYNGSKNESLNSEVNELPVSTGAGFCIPDLVNTPPHPCTPQTTGFAGTPTVLYTETDTPPGSYDDEIDAVAVDAVSGTVYFADQYNGILAFPNNGGTVNPADMYTVSTQGSKLLALDAKNNLYGAVYSSTISSGGADTAFVTTVNSALVPGLAGTTANGVTFPSSVLIGTSADTTYNLTVQVGTPAVPTVETGSFVTVVDNGTTCTADPSITVTSSDAEFAGAVTSIVAPGTVLFDAVCSGTMSGAASYPTTVTFTPTAGGTQSATLTVTDSASNSGVATASGVGLALTAQTITFTNPAASEMETYGIAPIVLAATGGGSGNPVVFSVDSGPATLGADGVTLTITGAGAVVIDANQAGNSTYAAATQAQLTITVVQASQTITFTAPPSSATIGGPAITLSAAADSGLTVTFSIDASSTGTGTITGNSLTVTGAGTLVIDANQVGNANYLAATQVQQSITVNAAPVIPAGANVILGQTNWIAAFPSGGALASGNAAGSSFGINSATGDMIVSSSYGNQVLDINVQTGAVTVLVDWGSDIGQNYNVGPVALDANNNLYVGGLYTNNVIKIPFVSGAYVAAPYPNLSGTPPTPANCTGSDTAECSFGSNLTNASNGYYFGIQSMTFDAAGDFFFSLTNANTAPEAIYECTAACLATGTPAATMIYMEPVSVVAAQYIVGGLAVDRWGNLFFTDSNYNGSKNESLNSEVNELPVSTGAGFCIPDLVNTPPHPCTPQTTGFAGTPTVLYTETDNPAGAYDDEIDGVAVDAVSGTVYFADQYNGIFAMVNNAGVVNPASMYTVSTQGSKILALDAKGNLYGVVYSAVMGASGDTAFQATMNNETFPETQVGGSFTNSATLNPVSVILNDGGCTTPETVTFTNPTDFSAALIAPVAPATTTCAGTMSGGSAFPAAVTFAPLSGGTFTETLTTSDSDGNSGTATLSGVGQSLLAQTITFTNPAASEIVTYGVAPIVLAATGGGSGNPVTFSVASGPATLGDDGVTLTITGVGAVVINANQAASSTYSAAPEVSLTITVGQAPQAITFAPASPVTFSTSPIALMATGGASGNPVTFTVTSGPGTISDSSLTLTGLGTVVIAADQAGNADYSAAPTVSASIVVNAIGSLAMPAFTPASGTALYLGESPITLSSTTGATIYYTIGTEGTTPTASSTAYTSAGIPIPTTVGTYTIEAIAIELGYTSSTVATATYTVSAIPPDFTFTINPSSLTLTAGQSGTVTATITPEYGFDTPITFTCSGLPEGASCPALSVTPNGTTPITGTLTIGTTANSIIARSNPSPLVPGATFAVALCCFLGFKRRRRLQMLILLAVSAIGLGLFTGCGGQWSPTFSVTTVQVTASSTTPARTHTASFSLTVNK